MKAIEGRGKLLGNFGYPRINFVLFRCVKLWNYRNGNCLATLSGHTKSITSVGFHPHLPIIISGSQVSIFLIFFSNKVEYKKILSRDIRQKLRDHF
jgi:WD40 repeat protein